MPQVDFPTISVAAGLPGASAQIMASSVATPLERQFGHIAGVTEMTSSSSLGSTNMTLQFDLSRNIDGAARDVEAGINAARTYLPANLPSNPTYRKVNPADAPIMIMGLTSDKYDRQTIYDAASTIMEQKLSQIQGVGQVTVGGGAYPSVRVDVNPTQLNSYGLTLQNIQSMLSLQNTDLARGQITDGAVTADIVTNDQISKADEYKPLIVGQHNGLAVRLSDVADVTDSAQNIRTAGFTNGIPSIGVIIFRQPGANIIQTNQRIRDQLPFLQAAIPQGIEATVDSRPHHHHPGLGARRRILVDPLGHPGHPGGFCVPAQCPRHLDSQRRGARLADRHLRGDVSARLQPGQSFADGAHHLHRLRGG